MKVFILVLIILFYSNFFNLYALTVQEAQLYGSRIIMCGDRQVNNWKLIFHGSKEDKGSEYLIFDMKKKRTYKMSECELYYCSPEPDRMKGCIMKEESYYAP